MEQPSGPDTASTRATWVGTSDASPPALDDDDDVIDAEIADVPIPAVSAHGTTPAADYSEAGVPSLAYLREKVEARYGTATGSAGLAEAAVERETAGHAASQQQAAQSAAERATALDQAAKDKLAEIRRSLRP